MKTKFICLMILVLSLVSCSKAEYLDFKESEEDYAALTRSNSDPDSDYFLSTLEQRKTIAEWLAKNYTLKDAKKSASGSHQSPFFRS